MDALHDSPLPEPGSHIFGRQSPVVTVAAGVLLILAISVIDKLTGYDFRLAILHLIPVAMVTWSAGRNWGLALSLAATAIWMVMFRTSHHYASNAFYYWEGLLALGTLWVFVVLMARLREALEQSEARFAVALDEVDEAIYVADPAHGEVLYCNERFQAEFPDGSRAELATARATRGGEPQTLSGRRYTIRERSIRWSDGRMVTLRVLREVPRT